MVKTKKKLRHKKLHSLLALALRDVAKQEKAKDSVVEMGTWYESNGKCMACAAGSVMRFTLGVSRATAKRRAGDISPLDFDADTRQRLWALNNLRSGCVRYAANDLFGHSSRVPSDLLYVSVADYNDDPQQWWKDMRSLHSRLKAANL